MNKVLAFISLGLFGYMGHAVWVGQSIGGGSSKARALEGIVELATSRVGPELTSIFLFSAGIILAFGFLIAEAQASRR